MREEQKETPYEEPHKLLMGIFSIPRRVGCEGARKTETDCTELLQLSRWQEVAIEIAARVSAFSSSAEPPSL